MEYQLDRWKRCDWYKNTRFYTCELRQNLFGQWVVVRRWGRVSAKQGQSIEHVCDRYEQGLGIFETVAKRRSQRGYRSW